MSRTRRNGWTVITGSDADNRGVKHHATNDWFSKKNACRGCTNDSWDEYWGRDKRGVKQMSRRHIRRANNQFIFDE